MGHDYCISNHSDFFTDCFISGQSKETGVFNYRTAGDIVLGAIATDRGQGGAFCISRRMHVENYLVLCAGAIFVATGKICKPTSWTWTRMPLPVLL